MNQEILSLRKDAPELRSVLAHGTVLRYGEQWAALPREVVLNPSREVEAIVFEVVRPEGLVRPSFWRIALRGSRLENLTITLSPYLAIVLYGMTQGWDPSWVMSGLSLLGVLFFQIAVYLLNDAEDYLRLIDLPGSIGGSGIIQKGWVSAAELQKIGYVVLAIGILLGLPAVLKSPQSLGVIGGIGALGVFGYSSRPLEMKYRTLGELAVFLCVGPLLVLGFSQATFGRLDFSQLSLGLFFGLVSSAISHASNLNRWGEREDAVSRGVSTLASNLGFRNSRHLLLGFYGLAYLFLGCGILLGNIPSLVGLSLALGVVPVFYLMRQVYRAAGPASALLVSVRRDAARVHLILGVLTGAAILFAYLIP